MAKSLWRLTLICFPVACAVPFESVFSTRQLQCGGQSFLQPCGVGFPASFCCPTTSTCVPINSTGIVATICCPDGASCDTIQPIVCNITLQNANRFPANPIHTQNLTAKLPLCNGQCCPLGFDCINNSCVARNDEAAAPSSSIVSSSTLTSQTSTSPVSSSPTPPVSSTTRTPSASTVPSASNSFSGRSFAAGFIPGIILGAAVLFGVIFFLARRRRDPSPAGAPRSPRSTAPPLQSLHGPKFRRQISKPLIQSDSNTRTDFYAKPQPPLPINEKTLPPAPPLPTAARMAKVSPPPNRTRATLSHHAEVGQHAHPLPPLPLKVPRSAGSVSPPRPLRLKNRLSIRPTQDRDEYDDRRESHGTIRVVMSPEPTPFPSGWGGGSEDVGRGEGSQYRLPTPPEVRRRGTEEGETPSRPPRRKQERKEDRETRFSNFLQRR